MLFGWDHGRAVMLPGECYQGNATNIIVIIIITIIITIIIIIIISASGPYQRITNGFGTWCALRAIITTA